VAIRYNCQRTCNSCRTQEIIDIDGSQASGLARDSAGAIPLSLAVTFDIDYAEMSTSARAALQPLLKSAFCGRIVAAGVACDPADLVLTLSANLQGRPHRGGAGAAYATVTLPSGTTQARAIAIADGIAANPITVSGGGIDGAAISSTGVTFETFETTREAGIPDNEGASDRSTKVVTVVLVAVLAVAALGAVYLLNSRSASSRFGKTNTVVELGWDNSAETACGNRQATVWYQPGSVDGSHFYPEDPEDGMAAFEPINVSYLGNSFSQAPPATQQPVGSAKFYPLSSRLNR